MQNDAQFPDHFPLLFHIALDLFRRPSPSGQEDLVRAYTVAHLEQHGFTVSVDPAGNVLAARGAPEPDEGYPLLSFHMDCISSETSFLTEYDASTLAALVFGSASSAETAQYRTQRRRAAKPPLRELDTLHVTRGYLHSKGAFVLGGDDKCGGAIALTLAATTKMPLKILASVEEEIGCVGVEQVDPLFFKDVAYALVLDRRGANHLVVSIDGHPLCQGTFAGAMMRAAAATGLLVYAVEGAPSDARTLSQHMLNVVNLSVGYYQPHTVEERVSLADLWRSYQWVKEALRSLPRQSDRAQPFAQRVAVEEALLCPRCQRLTLAPEDLPEDIWRFLCHCREAALAPVK
ncbi:MAG TPA: hypothetical protein VFV38_49885 [Ktedonobacteraceae bacterium]|nr:hypothetical protein [Ktedonobacteraceae bacterium]